MRVYEPGIIEDMILANAYYNILQAGDLDRLLTKHAHSLVGFLDTFKKPTVTFYENNDELGVWFLGWATPCFNGCLYGQWIHPKIRHTKSALRASLQVWDVILKVCPTVIGLTKQPEHIPEHLKLGYEHQGTIPHLWDGHDVEVLVLTQENFEPVKQRFKKLLETK